MRITTQLTNRNYQSFFWTKDKSNGICIWFIAKIFGETIRDCSIAFGITTKNPKRKGWVRVKRLASNQVTVNGKDFEVCVDEQSALDDLKVTVGDCFWVKVDKI